MGSLVPAIERPLTRLTLADSVYESLLESIVAGRIRSGQVLTTVALAQQLHVSRTPVAEALLRLTADGLVEQLPGRKARVRRFSREEIGDIYEMRKLLEPAATYRAASRLDDQSLAVIRDRYDVLASSMKKVDWPQRALEFDLFFHDTIAAASGSERLRQDIARYRLLVRAFCRLSGDDRNLREAFAEHGRILEALERREGDLARALMISHVDARLQDVLALLTAVE
ncbi:MAG: GntR family transcriptional regulator [Phycisphaeraceae bacterium]